MDLTIMLLRLFIQVYKEFMKKLPGIISFILIFSLLSGFFHKGFGQRFDDVYQTYRNYDQMGDDTDLVFIGTSETWGGISPMTLYEEAGITSYNLGQHWKASAVYYYELKYAIKSHHPKYAAVDFRTLFSDQTPRTDEDVYRQALYIIPDRTVRRELLLDICRQDPNEALYYLFPLLRFHSRWKDADFNLSPPGDDTPASMLGWHAYVRKAYYDTKTRELTPACWNTEDAEPAIPERDLQYYKKIIDLCRENDVQLIAVFTPVFSLAESQNYHWKTIRKFLDENHIPCFNYNTYEEAQRIGLDWNEDFYDASHLNYQGAIKWSRTLARDLSAQLGLMDHRGSSGVYSELEKKWKKGYKVYEY